MDKDRADKFSDTVDAETMKKIQDAIRRGELKPTRNGSKEKTKGKE